ncbi:hypothetical protein HPB50_003907 [Hyalomma asiaticum]|uniref:Uncharacterized protein n=1 Tax=Hyalomma asiaticum TaxID=266040 RepID=A0ACB7T876_HYAAI|nr:hypothetical protein HPB50_003907 [Hyalomma asiaticum]
MWLTTTTSVKPRPKTEEEPWARYKAPRAPMPVPRASVDWPGPSRGFPLRTRMFICVGTYGSSADVETGAKGKEQWPTCSNQETQQPRGSLLWVEGWLLTHDP